MPGILREDHGRVRLLRLDRPPSNAINRTLLAELMAELGAAEADEGVRCLVLASAVPKYFSSGLCLDELLGLPEPERPRLFEAMVAAHRRLAASPKPTLAAIEGYALLGGFILTLGCDWRLAAEETARVALSEVRLGLSPTAPLLRLVCGLSGRPGAVKELVLRGATLRAVEALEAGLVDRVLPAAGFAEAVLREAQKLAKLPPRAYAEVRRGLRAALMGDEDRLWAEGMREFHALFSGEEAREGLAAAKEKRKPRWE